MSYVANGTYFDSGVAQEDKSLITRYQDQWAAAAAASRAAKEAGNTEAYEAAEAAKARAHAGAEAVRDYYGYSGGADGSEYIPIQARNASVQQNPLVSEYMGLYNTRNAAYEQQLAAQKAAVRNAVSSLESQKNSTEAQYSDLFRQLYVDKMRNRKNLDQRLAAGGVTGGAVETTRLGYDTAYEDALRQTEQSRINAINSLDQAITDTKLTGDVSVATAAANAAKEQTNAYADALKYLINRQDELDERQESYAREDAQRAAAYAQKLAEQQKEAEEDADRPTLTVAQVNAAIKANILTDAVLRAYEYYYGAPYRG